MVSRPARDQLLWRSTLAVGEQKTAMLSCRVRPLSAAADQASFSDAPEHAELDATPAAADSSPSEGGARIVRLETDGRLRIWPLACLL